MISHNVNVKEIMLIGNREKKLRLVADFCQRLLDKSGFPAKIAATCDPTEGLEGAKYVINHVRVGGMAARLRDEKLPVKFGMIGDEVLGAGGIANALRTLPTVFEHAEIIETVSPDAVLINLTNPVGIVVEALTKYTGIKVLGACDMPRRYLRKIAKLLHAAPEEVWVDYIGLNHMGWIQDVKLHGRSCMGPLLERLERHKEDGFDAELIEVFRMIPTRTTATYFHQQDVLKQQRNCVRFRAEVLQEAEARILKLYQDKHLCEVPELARERNADWYEETVAPALEALEGAKEHDLVLCVRNDGAVRDLPEDCSVEVPARVSRRGMKVRKVGNCPRFLHGLFLAVKESDRLTIEAVRHQSYEFALQALAINPFVLSLHAAKRFLDRVIREEHLQLH